MNGDIIDPTERHSSRVVKVIESLKEVNLRNTVLPIRVFSEILPLDSVYFHV